MSCITGGGAQYMRDYNTGRARTLSPLLSLSLSDDPLLLVLVDATPWQFGRFVSGPGTPRPFVSNWNSFLFSRVASLFALLFGFGSGVPNAAADRFISRRRFPTESNSGSPAVSVSADICRRKRARLLLPWRLLRNPVAMATTALESRNYR